MTHPVLTMTAVRKNYGGLRPLRLDALSVRPGERVALSGIDAPGAELLVNLITGASLPDEGSIVAFGRATAEITEGEAWLASLERFGIVSARAVLLEASTVRQNLALPFTLNIEEPSDEVHRQVAGVAGECGLDEADLDRPVALLPADARMRVHLARAIALRPELLLIEHPTADVTEKERAPLGRDVGAALEGRGAAALIITNDAQFAEVAAHRSLALQPATGAVIPWKPKRGWFR